MPPVRLIWQTPYIVSFYPQYIKLNFFTSLFTWLPGQRNSAPHPWHIEKHLLKCTFSRILTHNRANLKEHYNQGIKIKSTRHHLKLLKKKTFLNGNSVLVTNFVQILVSKLFFLVCFQITIFSSCFKDL